AFGRWAAHARVFEGAVSRQAARAVGSRARRRDRLLRQRSRARELRCRVHDAARWCRVTILAIPPGWHLDQPRTDRMNEADKSVKHCGAIGSTNAIEAYYPVEIGAGLIASRYVATTTDRDAAIAAVIADFGEGAKREVGDKQLVLTLDTKDGDM